MKKFLKKSLRFSLFFALSFIIVNFFYLVIIAATDWDFSKRLESLKFINPDFELLVMGNSFPVYGIDTELLTSQGIKSYNLGLVGNSVKTCYFQLNEYLTKYSKRPQYVLLGLNSLLDDPWDSDGIEPIVEFTMKGHKYCMKDVPILKFKWLGKEVLKKIFSDTHRKTKIIYGQIKYPKITPDKTNYKKLYLDIQKFESSNWIGEIVKLCSQNGIEIKIVNMPGFRETQNLSEIGPYKLYFNNGYSAVLYNFNGQDFCKKFDAVKDWSGISHFNEIGASKLTEDLVSIIKD